LLRKKGAFFLLINRTLRVQIVFFDTFKNAVAVNVRFFKPKKGFIHIFYNVIIRIFVKGIIELYLL